MRTMVTIWGRELAACFLSPVAYVLMVVFVLVSTLTFLAAVVQDAILYEPLTIPMCESMVVWLTILVTAVCMRLFAEEKRSGTIEALLTAPVTEAQVVFGKYLGALSFLLLAVLPVVMTMIGVIIASPALSLADLDTGALISSLGMLVLLTAMLTALGTVTSLLTTSQVSAAICCFCAVWGVLLMGWILSMLPGGLESEYVTVTEHIREFARGTVDSRPLVLYSSLTAWLLFTAIRMLEARRWK